MSTEAKPATAEQLAAVHSRIDKLHEQIWELENKKGGGGQADGSLAERLVNIEHLLGVKLPLRKIGGLDHPTSLPAPAAEKDKKAA